MKVKSTADKVWDYVFVFLCLIVSAICIIPMLNLLAKSLSATEYLIRNEVYILPKGFNFDAYGTVLKDPKYLRAFFVDSYSDGYMHTAVTYNDNPLRLPSYLREA